MGKFFKTPIPLRAVRKRKCLVALLWKEGVGQLSADVVVARVPLIATDGHHGDFLETEYMQTEPILRRLVLSLDESGNAVAEVIDNNVLLVIK